MLKKLGPRKTLGILCFINLITWVSSPVSRSLFSALTMNIPMGLGPDLSKALGYSAGTSVLLLILNNGIGSLPGVAIGHIADKIGHQNTLFIAMIITTLSTWILWLIRAKAGTKCMWLTFILHGLGRSVPDIV